MRTKLTALFFILFTGYGYGQAWNTAGTNIVSAGSNLHRDGNLSSPHLQHITSSTVFTLGDTLYGDPDATGAYNMMGLSDVNPVNSPYTANNEGNAHVKFAFYHGYRSTGSFLSVIQNGVQSDVTDFGNIKKLRIIYDEMGMRFEKSVDGVTWVLHKLGAKGTGTYFPFVQLQNQNTYSAWNNVRIGRKQVPATNTTKYDTVRITVVDTTCQIVSVYVDKGGGYAMDETGTALYKAIFGVFPPSLKDAPIVEQFIIAERRYTLYKNGAWRREKKITDVWVDDPF